jgi:polyferredoxin
MGPSHHQTMIKRPNKRLIYQIAFLILFILTPVLDIFRLDLNQGHFIIFGYNLKLNLQELVDQNAGMLAFSERILFRAILPIVGSIIVFLLISWRWGRLYCGWLCPHFTVVEYINTLMRKASGKPSIWEPQLPEHQLDGTVAETNKWWWIPTIIMIVLFAFTWAVLALTYLLTPSEIYSNLIHFSFTRNQSIFITAVTLAFIIEFTFARHLFCRYACAVGVFQSFAWMANKKAMVVGFNSHRAKECKDCDKSCEHACPMRLKPRNIKRKIFTCTQCYECIDACDRVQQVNGKPPILKMLIDECALDKSKRDFGKKVEIPAHCFEEDTVISHEGYEDHEG